MNTEDYQSNYHTDNEGVIWVKKTYAETYVEQLNEAESAITDLFNTLKKVSERLETADDSESLLNEDLQAICSKNIEKYKKYL